MKVTIIGFDFSEGISKKTNKPYAIGKLYAACKIDGQNAKGMQGTEYGVDPEVVKRLAHLPLPFEADLQVEDVMRYGERVSKVLDVIPVARVDLQPAKVLKAA